MLQFFIATKFFFLRLCLLDLCHIKGFNSPVTKCTVLFVIHSGMKSSSSNVLMLNVIGMLPGTTPADLDSTIQGLTRRQPPYYYSRHAECMKNKHSGLLLSQH